MQNPSLVERITRSLAYMLRHQPEQFDLELDEYGFADLDAVVGALNERLGEPVEAENVVESIEGGDRTRYEIREGKIRALYGHSIQVKPGEPAKPPALLYVGISRDDAERARRYGLRPGRRSFLHLALTAEDALETGRRASRDYAVVTVNALDAWEDGVNFYDRKSLFLSDPIPTNFLQVGDVQTDGYGEQEEVGRGGRGGRNDRGGRPGRGDAPRREPPRFEEARHGQPRFEPARSEGDQREHVRSEAPRERVEPARPETGEREPLAVPAARDRGDLPPAREGQRGGDRHGRGDRRPDSRGEGRGSGRGEPRGDNRPRRDDRPHDRPNPRERQGAGDRPEPRAPVPMAPRERAPQASPPQLAPTSTSDSGPAGSFGLGVFEAPKRPHTPPAPREPEVRPREVAPPKRPDESKRPDPGDSFGAGI